MAKIRWLGQLRKGGLNRQGESGVMEDAGRRVLPMIKAPGRALLRVLGANLPRVGVCLLRLRGSGRPGALGLSLLGLESAPA